MGVRNAVEAAEKALGENSKSTKKIFTLGPLIHNPVVMNSLQDRGITVLDSDDLSSVDENSVVIIRAHGTTLSVIDELNRKKALIVDATCPHVHLSQKRAREFSENGYDVIIAGDRNHGEVVSISSYAGENVTVVENVAEADVMDVPSKAVLIAQTTFSPVEFEKIVSSLKSRIKELKVFNSICSATMQRQTSLRELEGKADGILVIGGRNSANTRRLFETASSICKNVALIENSTEIPESFFKLKNIAITAGASTPDNVIEDVESFLKKSNF